MGQSVGCPFCFGMQTTVSYDTGRGWGLCSLTGGIWFMVWFQSAADKRATVRQLMWLSFHAWRRPVCRLSECDMCSVHGGQTQC